MRARYLFCVLAIAAVAVFGLVGAVSATTIYDDFTGTSLDTTKWTVMNAGGTIVFDGITNMTFAGPAAPEQIGSKTLWGINTTFEFKIGATGTNNARYQEFGIYDVAGLAGSPQIFVKDMVTSGAWTFYVGNATTNHTYTLAAAPAAGDVYDIAWTSASVVLSRNSTVLVTDTANVPAATSSMFFTFFDMYGGSASYDYVGTVVPEPSTLMLMASGLFGLLAYAWRKRK